MYRASFNGIYAETLGVYKMYGITPYEATELRRIHNGKVSGSDGTYTIYDQAETFMWLQLYVHDVNRMIKINIRPLLMQLTGKQRFTDKFLTLFRKEVPKVILVDVVNNKFVLANQDKVITETLRKIGYLKKKK